MQPVRTGITCAAFRASTSSSSALPTWLFSKLSWLHTPPQRRPGRIYFRQCSYSTYADSTSRSSSTWAAGRGMISKGCVSAWSIQSLGRSCCRTWGRWLKERQCIRASGQWCMISLKSSLSRVCAAPSRWLCEILNIYRRNGILSPYGPTRLAWRAGSGNSIPHRSRSRAKLLPHPDPRDGRYGYTVCARHHLRPTDDDGAQLLRAYGVRVARYTRRHRAGCSQNLASAWKCGEYHWGYKKGRIMIWRRYHTKTFQYRARKSWGISFLACRWRQPRWYRNRKWYCIEQ